MKKIIFLCIAVSFYIFTNLSFAQDTPAKEASVTVDKVTAEGLITEVAADQTYIVVGEGDKAVKFMTSPEFLQDAYLEVGDHIKAYGEKDTAGIKLIDYEYVVEESGEPVVPESAVPESEPAPQSEQSPGNQQ